MLAGLTGAALSIIVLSGCAGGGAAHSTDSAEARRYSHLMHNRFYEAWVQPSAVAAPRGKISVSVDVQIDRGGHIASFKIVKPSGNEKIDRSIAEVGEKIRQVTPPPLGSSQKRFDLRIYFELDVKPE